MFNPSAHPPRRLALDIAKLLCVAAVLAGCGGGGSDNSTANTATTFSAGPITGFGSVIVNGVRFDDSAARISDDDDATRGSSDLKLGMMAEIEAADVRADSLGASHGRALAIRFGSEIVGPVSAIDTTAKTLTIIGQIVDVTDNTVFDDRLVGGLSGIKSGAVVEVHAVLNASTGHYSATRIEPKPNAPFFKVRGVVASLDIKAKTFKIGDATISYAALIPADVPAALADGLLVRVKLQTTQVAGVWVATRLSTGLRKIENHDEAEVHGTITAFTSATQFSVNGIAVDATNAVFLPSKVGVVLGARVEVEGKAVDGIIVATKVSLEDELEVHVRGLELHGSISALDATAKTFVLRGVTVSFADVKEYKGGTQADLKNDRQVEVKGMLGADGKTLAAVRIEFDK